MFYDLRLQVVMVSFENILSPVLEARWRMREPEIEEEEEREITICWVRISKTEQQIIEGAVSTQYMPTADDFGKSIEVQITEQTLFGKQFPPMKARESIDIDPFTRSNIEQLKAAGSAVFNIWMNDTEQMLKLTKNHVKIKNGMFHVAFSTSYSSKIVVIIRVDHPLLFSLVVDDFAFELKANSPSERDVIVECVRRFVEKFSADKPEEKPQQKLGEVAMC
jgi:hypothetical protein